MRSFSLLCALSVWVIRASAQTVIVSGAIWTDTDGNEIQAHGAGLIQVDSTFYWIGEDKSHNSGLFKAVRCYSSTDFVNWSRQNDALTPVAGTDISDQNIVERPKVIYNEKNREYVMWFHSDSSNYGAAEVGLATADTPCGPYDYKGSWKPFGADSRDMGLFQDTDGTAYLLYASDNNQNFKISRLNDDYYNVTEQVTQINASTLESPGIVKRDTTYYLFASHTTGWNPNPNKVLTASSLSGPWSSEADIAPANTRTYFSQNAFDLPWGNDAVYIGDRWRPEQLGNSRYIWYPLEFSSGSPQIVYADLWSVDVDARTWTIHSGTNYEAESGTLSGNAQILNDSSFSDGEAVGWLGNGGSLTINDVQGEGREQWIALYYANGDSSWRNITVSVNGGESVVVDQPDTGGGHVIFSVPVKVQLNSGANAVTFASGQNSYAGDLDKIIVYTRS